MIIKLLIISVILVFISLLALGVKMLISPDAEFPAHSCALENNSLDSDGACSKCQLKDLADCPESKNNNLKNKIVNGYKK
jgi:hypothetical protein